MDYPKTDRKNVIEILHSYKISDYYRWLENGNNAKVQDWTKKQNKLCNKVLNKHAKPEKYQKELKAILNVTNFGCPVKFGNRYFWMERKGKENQGVLYVKNGFNGKPKILVNPNKEDKEGLISLDYWNASKTGKYVAYGLSKSGDENATMYVLDVDSKKVLKDKIPFARHSSLRWLPDGSGFYYTRHPIPGNVPKGEELYHHRVNFHKLGGDTKEDLVVFGEGRPKEDSHSISLTQDGHYLFITTNSDWVKTEVYSLNTKTGEIKTVVAGPKNIFRPRTIRDQIFLYTNYKADNFRVLTSKLSNIPKNIDDWEEFIPESKDVLQGISMTFDKILAIYLSNVSNKVKIFNYSGKYLEDLAIPPFSSVGGMSTSREEKEFFYGVSNFYCGNQQYRYDPETKIIEDYRKSELSLPENEYRVRQDWFLSKDGAKVPMFIFHKKDIKYDGKNPTVLYGYGGFSSSLGPGFFSNYLPFLKRGGIFVTANIRGGSEFGEKWHREGMLDKKMNTFNDFIAAAEYLIDKKITSSEKLAILGGSNGGLLVVVCMLLKPDLFKAVVSRVALLDMVRFPKFLMAKRWVFEYGDPEKKKDFARIIKWSPYHNVKKGANYPSVLFAISKKDTRVDPLHSRKMTALMQYSNKDNTVLLRTEMQSGHGPGKSKEKMIEAQADTLAFLDWQLV